MYTITGKLIPHVCDQHIQQLTVNHSFFSCLEEIWLPDTFCKYTGRFVNSRSGSSQ